MDKAVWLDPSNRVLIDLHSLVQCQPDKHILEKEKLGLKFQYQIYLASTIIKDAQSGPPASRTFMRVTPCVGRTSDNSTQCYQVLIKLI